MESNLLLTCSKIISIFVCKSILITNKLILVAIVGEVLCLLVGIYFVYNFRLFGLVQYVML